MSNKTALIIGATGLVGEQCLKLLLASADYSRVIALTRSPLALTSAKLQNPVVDFSQLEKVKGQIAADDIFCTIGTTMAKAGSQEAFKRVDFDIPLQAAAIAKANGAKTFILVSSLGANAKSTVFYSRIKGELEDALAKLNYQSLVIFRPSILIGNRNEKRTGEEIGRFVAEKLSFVFAGPLKKYKGTPVVLLAAAMLKAANAGWNGVRIVENEEIFDLAEIK
jgi:uncharacterized protein YbjT (DUF2867 family)